MDRSVSFYLLTPHRVQDDLLQWVDDPIRREVFGQISSVTSTEFFSAGQNGISPEFRMTMFAPDYEGEQDLEYNGQIYSIYRTYYGRNDTLELYVERRRGDGGGSK